MKNKTFIKILCLVLACLLLVPMIIACGDDEKPDADENKDDAPEQVTITFSLRGGYITDGKDEVKITKGAKLAENKVPVVEKDNCEFLGWSYARNDADLEDEWDPADKFSDDTTLYAQWSESTSGGNGGNGGGTGDTVTVTFNGRGGSLVSGSDTIVINKGGKIVNAPVFERSGYTFKCWAYDMGGLNEWFDSDTFAADTPLYAIWVEGSTGGGTGGGTGGDDTTNKITIEYNTGSGYFEDVNQYEVKIEVGGRINVHPTPVHQNPAMSFVAWFKDSACTIQVSPSDKYTTDTTLYAKWLQLSACNDGSYNHDWGFWDTESLPTCTKPGTQSQFCKKCGAKNVMDGDPATGHTWKAWEEGFLRRERVCSTLGCGAQQFQEFENVTLSTLGNSPAAQMKLEMGAGWGSDRVACLVNGNWDEANGGTFCGNSCEVKVTINLVTPTAMDRIYVKGHGLGASFNIYAQYEGDSDYSLVGAGAFLSDAQNGMETRTIPFAAVDNTRKIVSVQVIMPNASFGQDYWDEVAFIVIPPVENE